MEAVCPWQLQIPALGWMVRMVFRSGRAFRGLGLVLVAVLAVGCGAPGGIRQTVSAPGAAHRSSVPSRVAAVPANLQGFRMVTPEAGAAVSLSMLYQTTDGGRTWTPVRPITNAASLFPGPQGSILLVTMRRVAGSRLQLTTGVGVPDRPWTFRTAVLTLAIQTSGGYPSLHCSLRTPAAAWCLFASGGGMQLDASQLWQTVNAGANWTALGTAKTPPGTVESGLKGRPVWTTPEDGWLTASTLVTVSGALVTPVLYQTVDGGARWAPDEIPAPSFSGTPGTLGLSSLTPVPGGSAWAMVATTANAAGTVTRLTVLRSTGPNASWIPVGRSLRLVGLVPDAHLFVTGPRVWWLWTGQSLYRTVDAAQTWESVSLPSRLRAKLHDGAVGYMADFLNASTAWILLQNPNGSNVLWHLTRQTWQAWVPQVRPR